MEKYTIEGNLDFYSELYKSLDNNPKENECESACLITNLPLTQFHVTLECNHKFNYVPLFNEIQNQKLKVNTLNTNHLDKNQVMCPYCRSNTNTVLPFYEELGLSKMYGINTLDIAYKLPSDCLYSGGRDCVLGVCEYVTTNENNETIPCNNKWVYKIKDDTKCYCYTHKLLVMTKILVEKKLKEKQAKLAAKQAAKQAAKDAKLAAKQAEKDAKKAIKDAEKATKDAEKAAKKAESKPTTSSSASSSSAKKSNPKHQPTPLELCTEILKSGKNSGTQCKCKALANGKCGRHTKAIPENVNVGENIIISSNSQPTSV